MKSQNIRSLDSLGEKLRRLRTQKGMTQSEVSKGIVTRNMLSRIENGAALPSLETLAELADRLGVPCGFLLSESALEAFDLLDFKHELERLFKEKRYAAALKLISENTHEADDEIYLTELECLFATALEAAAQSEYRKAFECLEDTVSKLELTAYSVSGIGLSSTLYHEFAKRVLPEQAGAYGKQSPPSLPQKFKELTDMLIYLKLSDLFDSNQIVKAINLASLCEIENKTLSTHIAARLDMAGGRYQSAESKLNSIIESAERSPDAIANLLIFKVYGDLEECAKSIGDYVSAYGYKEKKLKLYEKTSGIKL